MAVKKGEPIGAGKPRETKKTAPYPKANPRSARRPGK